MTISKKDQEKLIGKISNDIGTRIAALILLEVVKMIVSGESIHVGEMKEVVEENITRTLSRYQITEKPN